MLKVSTIEKLRDLDIITLEECDKSEQNTNDNVVRDKNVNKHYKISQSEGEIQIELLNACLKVLTTIKEIIVFFATIGLIYIIYMLTMSAL